MKKAWIIDSVIKDVCPSEFDPIFLYGEEIGINYDTDVPDDAEHGWYLNADGEWVAPEPFVIPEPVFSDVPFAVTPRQARLVLALQPSPQASFPHLLALIEDGFNQLPEPDKTLAKISWEYATSIERTSPLIAQMRAVIGLDDEQIDDLFRQAATL